MKPILEFIGLFAIAAIAAAFGFLDDLGSIAALLGLWISPLALSLLHIAVFCKVARASEMALGFIAGTLTAIIVLTAAGIGLLKGQFLLCSSATMAAIGLYTAILLRTAGLARLASGFRRSTDMWPGFPSFPTASASRFVTMPMFEMIGGAALIVLVTIAPVSKVYGLWIYAPAVLFLAVGLVMQMCHLMAHRALERAGLKADS